MEVYDDEIHEWQSVSLWAHLNGWSCGDAGGLTGRTFSHSLDGGKPWSSLSCEQGWRDSTESGKWTRKISIFILTNQSWNAEYKWKKLLFYLKAADSYIDLTAALVWTVEHFEHPICLNDRASPVSLGPDTAETELTKRTISEMDLCWAPGFQILVNVSECVRACGPLTCSDWAAALCHHPAPKHERWAAAAACHSDLQTIEWRRITKWLTQVLSKCSPSIFEDWTLKDFYLLVRSGRVQGWCIN